MAPFLSKHIYHSIKNVVPAFQNEENYFDLHTQQYGIKFNFLFLFLFNLRSASIV